MRSLIGGVLAVCLVGVGCERGPEQQGGGAVQAADTAARGDTLAITPADVDSGHAAHIRPGEPAPLLVIMRQLNADMQALTTALMTDDREGVVGSAAAIANHAPIAHDDVERIRHELGPEMADFERIDEEVHDASLQLSEIAVTGQMYEVIDRLADVQRGCIACHTLYRTELTRGRQ